MVDNLRVVRYFVGSYSLAHSNGEVIGKADAKLHNANADCKIGLAHDSCQTSLGMAEMQVVRSLTQLAYCEPNITPSPTEPLLVYISSGSSSSSERSAPTSSSPPTARGGPMCSQAGCRVGMPCPNSVQSSPYKVPNKAKWNSTVRCNWPPCSPSSPTRLAGGGATAFTPRGPVASPAVKTRNVGVMTYCAINSGELIKKVESLEIELGVHVGNERQLLSVNEQLRKRQIGRVSA